METLDVLDNVLLLLDARALLAAAGVARSWRSRVAAANEAWRSSCRMEFGEELRGAFPPAFQREQRRRAGRRKRWAEGKLSADALFLFASFLRSWDCDEELLVAGLYDGRLQALDWRSGRTRRPFRGGHGDEVVSVALGADFVLSGSGDPGYHNRRPSDASVKLWTREGELLGSGEVHKGSVRGLALLDLENEDAPLAVSAATDGLAVLWSLRPSLRPLQELKLPGPCRCLKAAAGGRRLLAAAGEFVVELELVGRELRQLRAVRAPCTVASLDLDLPPCAAAEDAPLLEAAEVAGGGTKGEVWRLRGSEIRVCGDLFSQGQSCVEVVSVEVMRETRQILALCRTGVLALFQWKKEGEKGKEAVLKWAKAGWRMYASRLKRRGPELLLTDGFDNALGAISVGGGGSCT